MVNYNEWMSQLNGDVNVGHLSIPGTHNSAASHTAMPSVKCQDKSITEQLNNGVRFFDIRLGKFFFKDKDTDGDGHDDYNSNDLQVIHGKFPVKMPFPLEFSKVLEEFYSFLDENPKESCIVSLKQEGSNSWDNDNDEFGNFIWNNYISKNEDKWYLNNQLPNLNDCRGKIILFRRFGIKDENKANNYGIEASYWSYNTTDEDRGSFRVQDFCEINDRAAIDQKADHVKQFMTTATEYNGTQSSNPKLFLNFCSGANFFDHQCWPEEIANRIETCGIQDNVKRGCGIVIVDYAGKNDWSIVKRMVDSNF
ncbi:hypothetical protein TBLA_0G03650 [Henningerozyma blattae CBS 6284]|uniref:Phosphatidylinositol-specific phospholipase C X domain-containing protein n=1 Tax=Henningerozyma blattae (strain ATCC 34711 / CBS 6284 / DSM 70876 / NBRC 10599 / NRRL Y-10934 / UCD 77-7) TaxID=1071380 RepID=I2H7E7_HENB6|nr:hypothetical protein TBLA_0G03650 [Tetrapisispora blattae CBS 6284]CCH62299.1 hypothetical protein TBLA_0G03650 [Tetrapisispora blattae CBS 6284]